MTRTIEILILILMIIRFYSQIALKRFSEKNTKRYDTNDTYISLSVTFECDRSSQKVPYIRVYKKRNTEMVVYRNESIDSASVDFVMHDISDDKTRGKRKIDEIVISDETEKCDENNETKRKFNFGKRK